jgi:hypothetical protein
MIAIKPGPDSKLMTTSFRQMTGRLSVLVCLVAFLLTSKSFGDQQFEFCNNFLMNLSFITGTNRGMDQNLEDNLTWMNDQGYTHLRFFGIFANRVHCFPSPTLNANGYPRSSYHESVLALLATKCQEHNIVLNFDGWEVIAEANYDTAAAGVGYITVDELGDVLQEVLSYGVPMISEEQFGSGYIQEIQSVCSAMGATHETTAALWWQESWASLIADEQLSNVFSFYPYTQAQADSAIAAGNPYSLLANLGALHYMLEGCRYFNVPTSVAVGSFGTLQAENWRNVLRFVQINHHPDRFSIEEQNTDLTIWNPGFNFMQYVGNDLNSFADMAIADRPTVNLVINAASLSAPTFLPAWYASQVDAAAIVNTFAAQGYKVVATVDTVLPEADAYYVLLAGGANSPDVASLPDYVPPLLESGEVVFLQPCYGIPDDNDGGGWEPLRQYFGLPSGETETLTYAIPDSVDFGGHFVKWAGVKLYLTPCLERLRSSDIDTSQASIALVAKVGADDVALVIRNGNKYLVNSNLINIEVSYVFSSLLDGPIVQPAAADIVIADGKGLIFAEYDTDIEVSLPWSGTSHLLRYDPEGYPVSDQDTVVAGSYSATLSRGELVILTSVTGFTCGDADANSVVNISDAVYLIGYIFGGGAAPDPPEAGDVDCNQIVNISDAVYLISYIFGGGPAPCASCQ